MGYDYSEKSLTTINKTSVKTAQHVQGLHEAKDNI